MPSNKYLPGKYTWLLAAALLFVTALYWPGLSGGWLFDDYPNIVDNKGVQPSTVDLASITRAALSSPASDLKRPLASLSFALNYYAAGLDPFSMKLTNLIIHLTNGVLVFFLSRRLLSLAQDKTGAIFHGNPDVVALLLSLGWMLLPINITAVLYVVQRMESLANAFVLAGLLVYIASRVRMRTTTRRSTYFTWLIVCLSSMGLFTALGSLAKETAVMLPAYACLAEWLLFGFHTQAPVAVAGEPSRNRRDPWIIGLFFFCLALPLAIGLSWLLPTVFQLKAWEGRDFDMAERLFSEARIVTDYISWIVLPTPHSLSFYHDDFVISKNAITPWSTAASMAGLVALTIYAVWVRTRRPLIALGIFMYLTCHLLTATVLPLELIYEHRNYFASFAVLVAVVPEFVRRIPSFGRPFKDSLQSNTLVGKQLPTVIDTNATSQWPIAVIVLGTTMLWWTIQTAMTSYAWGDPLRLARELASRAPMSPRAQYELGRTYIIYSKYDPSSPFTPLAYAPLERAAEIPASSILPEQALIFFNARLLRPIENAWWDSIVAKLKNHPVTVQDESALGALAKCSSDGSCDLSRKKMTESFKAALSRPRASARLYAMYADYLWTSVPDRSMAATMIERAVERSPAEPAYRITSARMLSALGDEKGAKEQLSALEQLNVGGSLDKDIDALRSKLSVKD
jgi:hypothetical protein